jgi:hypothetical protein
VFSKTLLFEFCPKVNILLIWLVSGINTAWSCAFHASLNQLKEELTQMAKKPLVLHVSIICVVLVALLNVLSLPAIIAKISTHSAVEVVVTFTVTLLVFGLAFLVFFRVKKQSPTALFTLRGFFWFMLIVYPLRNLLIGQGYYLAGPSVTPQEAPAAAMAELLRTVFLLVMIVWTGMSKKLKGYLA